MGWVPFLDSAKYSLIGRYQPIHFVADHLKHVQL